jgi:aspartokinase
MNAAKETATFIGKHPIIKECLGKGLVNYSELARQMIEGGPLSESDFDAVLVAIRRYAEHVRISKDSEKTITKLLAKSNLEIKNKVCSVVLADNVPFSYLVKLIEEINKMDEPGHLIQGSRTFTLITSQSFLEKIEKMFKGNIVSKKKNLVQVVLRSTPELESTPGAISYIYGLFAERGINIIETMSSWTETLIVIDEKDLAKAMEVLKF